MKRDYDFEALFIRMLMKQSFKSERKPRRIPESVPQPRRHRCENCRHVFVCESCTAMLEKTMSTRFPLNRIGIYGPAHRISNASIETPVLLCPSCEVAE